MDPLPLTISGFLSLDWTFPWASDKDLQLHFWYLASISKLTCPKVDFWSLPSLPPKSASLTISSFSQQIMTPFSSLEDQNPWSRSSHLSFSHNLLPIWCKACCLYLQNRAALRLPFCQHGGALSPVLPSSAPRVFLCACWSPLRTAAM